MKGKNSRFITGAIMAAIVLVVYNVILFMIAGGEHGGAFWTSYAFMMVALASTILCASLLADRAPIPRDWLLLYPFYKHCYIYLIAEFVISTIFMFADASGASWKFAFIVQLLLLVAFIIFIGSCFMAKEIIENVQKNVKVNTAFMKNLRVDVDMIVAKLQNPQNHEVKAAFEELADKIRYSDPMSNDALRSYEEELKAQIDRANVCISCNDNDEALRCCKKAMLLLLERNERCKLLK